jgi:hypothetical protein
MLKHMATNPKPSVQKTKLDKFAADLITDINRCAEKMSPDARAEADRKTLEIAARVRARRGKQ